MPLYEYRCDVDGSLVTLLRSMSEADDPVEDPEGRGRAFNRVHSTFQVDAPVPSHRIDPGPSGGCGCGAGGCGHF
ncbi:MAG: hypothetical protein P8J89_03135 [Phycisphaerales bacterium]|nr:hypothetical protein [Phycisphaerales bacterium]